MPNSDHDFWASIVSTDPDQEALHYLTYAKYSFEKYEWYEQFERQTGKAPTESEINGWISQITDARIRAWREAAARTFDVAAREYLKNEIIREKQQIIDNSVVSVVESRLRDIQNASSFGKQLFIGFVIAILSPIILGLVIIAIQAADLWPTATGVAHLFGSQSSHDASKPP